MSGKGEKAKRALRKQLLEAIARHKAQGVAHKHAALLALEEVTGQPSVDCARFINELTRRFPQNWATEGAAPAKDAMRVATPFGLEPTTYSHWLNGKKVDAP